MEREQAAGEFNCSKELKEQKKLNRRKNESKRSKISKKPNNEKQRSSGSFTLGELTFPNSYSAERPFLFVQAFGVGSAV